MKRLHMDPHLAAGISAAAALTWPATALPQVPGDWPSKPIVVTSAYDAGGIQGRVLALYFRSIQAATGKQFVMGYRPGAGTTIGTGYVAKSSPDGYNLFAASPAMTIMPSIYAELPFDPIGDFAPVSLLSKQASLLVVTATAPYTSLPEYISYARANPGKLNWGTGGAGSTSHLPGEYLHSLTKTKVTFVHYKSGNQRYTDTAGGTIDVTMGSLGNVAGLIKAGKLRALAVTTNKRVPSAPDIPTIDEQGVKGYDFSGWLGIVAPAKTPAAIIDRLNNWFVGAAKDPEVRKTESDGSLILATSPGEFAQLLKAETAVWRKVIREGGLKIDPD